MNPSDVSVHLRLLADGIDQTRNPNRGFVASRLKQILAMINPTQLVSIEDLPTSHPAGLVRDGSFPFLLQGRVNGQPFEGIVRVRFKGAISPNDPYKEYYETVSGPDFAEIMKANPQFVDDLHESDAYQMAFAYVHS